MVGGAGEGGQTQGGACTRCTRMEGLWGRLLHSTEVFLVGWEVFPGRLEVFPGRSTVGLRCAHSRVLCWSRTVDCPRLTSNSVVHMRNT